MDIKSKLLAAGGRIWDKKGHRIYDGALVIAQSDETIGVAVIICAVNSR